MAETSRPVRTASLEVAKGLYLATAALSTREALLFARGDSPANAAIAWPVRTLIVIGFLTTLFRYSHGVAVVYEIEKKAAQESTIPSPKRLEWIVGAFFAEAIAFFLMASSLGEPRRFVGFTLLLLAADLFYIVVSKAIRAERGWHIWLAWMLVARWRWTRAGSAARTHIVWALTDWIVALMLVLIIVPWHVVIGDTGWNPIHVRLLVLALVLSGASVADYLLNSPFYFSGDAARGKRPLVFVCTYPAGAIAAGDADALHESDMARLLWYCRQLYDGHAVLPFSPEVFLSYVLHDTPHDRALKQQCTLELLRRCDAVRVYTPDGTADESTLTAFMKDVRKIAIDNGLAITFAKSEPPPDTFRPSWAPIRDAETCAVTEVSADRPMKCVFVCTPLREGELFGPPLEQRLRENIRKTQWLCHRLVVQAGADEGLAPVAPHAFYPYFTTIKDTTGPNGITWLNSALEIIRFCDSMYVYTESGSRDDREWTKGMRKCIERAEALGLDLRFERWPQKDWLSEQKDWHPAVWRSPDVRSTDSH